MPPSSPNKEKRKVKRRFVESPSSPLLSIVPSSIPTSMHANSRPHTHACTNYQRVNEMGEIPTYYKTHAAQSKEYQLEWKSPIILPWTFSMTHFPQNHTNSLIGQDTLKHQTSAAHRFPTAQHHNPAQHHHPRQWSINQTLLLTQTFSLAPFHSPVPAWLANFTQPHLRNKTSPKWGQQDTSVGVPINHFLQQPPEVQNDFWSASVRKATNNHPTTMPTVSTKTRLGVYFFTTPKAARN